MADIESKMYVSGARTHYTRLTSTRESEIVARLARGLCGGDTEEVVVVESAATLG